MATVSLIVAAAANNVIGVDGDLPWHISDDLKRFKALTSGHTVIMGRATWESLPFKPLPKRRNLVLTRQDTYAADGAKNGAEIFSNLEDALASCAGEEEVFIMGGGQIYAQAMEIAHKIYLTRVHESIKGDTVFPEIPERFAIESQEDILDHQPPYSFIDLVAA